MEEYIERSAAVCAANYAIDEHPYDKDPARPETFSDYNSGWNDACDYIQEKLELLPAADVAPVKHGAWIAVMKSDITGWEPEYAGRDPIGGYLCSCCQREAPLDCNDKWVLSQYCPACGCKMDGGNDGV